MRITHFLPLAGLLLLAGCNDQKGEVPKPPPPPVAPNPPPVTTSPTPPVTPAPGTPPQTPPPANR